MSESFSVTLGRALIELGALDEGAGEFGLVLKTAPDNLAAIRGMAEIEQRRENLSAALDYYKRALSLARFDPDLEETVQRIGRELGAVAEAAAQTGLSFEQATSELLSAAARVTASAPQAVRDEAITAAAASEASAPAAPGQSAEPLIDFDAILAELGAPDALPPPLMELLLAPHSRPSAPPEPPSADPVVVASAPVSFMPPPSPAASSSPNTDAAVAAVVDELESWLRVLRSERSARGV